MYSKGRIWHRDRKYEGCSFNHFISVIITFLDQKENGDGISFSWHRMIYSSFLLLGPLFLHQVYHNKSATLFLDFTLSETTTTTKHEENMSKSQLRCSSVRNSKPLLSFMITLGERLLFACFFPALPAVLPLLPESQFIFSVMNSFGK